MKKLLLFGILFLQLLVADTREGNDIDKVNAATVNTLLIFTSQEGLNSGKYTFTNTPVDVNMDIYHLPLTYQLKTDTLLNYFIVGNVGYSRVYLGDIKEEVPPEYHLDKLNHIQTYTAGFGGGARYEILDKLYVSAGIEFIYSRAGVSVRDEEGVAKDFFNKNYSDNISYKIFSLLEYRPIWYEFKPYATLGYKLFETKSDFSFDETFSFDSESSVTSLSLGAESPKLYSFGKQNITLEAYITAHYLSGIVREVVDFDLYRSIGAVIYYNTPAGPWWASRFFIEANTVDSNGLEGYNFGIGFTMDF